MFKAEQKYDKNVILYSNGNWNKVWMKNDSIVLCIPLDSTIFLQLHWKKTPTLQKKKMWKLFNIQTIKIKILIRLLEFILIKIFINLIILSFISKKSFVKSLDSQIFWALIFYV